jgi:hypothetical protein
MAVIPLVRIFHSESRFNKQNEAKTLFGPVFVSFQKLGQLRKALYYTYKKWGREECT